MAGLSSATTPRRQFVRTDFDGPSNSSDYAEGVWDRSGNRIPPGVQIAPGTAVSVGGPSTTPYADFVASSGGGQFGTGNQIRLDDATIAHMAAQDKQAADALKANTAYQTGSLGIQTQQLANDRATQAENAQYHLASLGLTQKQIDNQFATDTARLGIERANELRQERQDAATNALALANFGLSKDSLNASIANNKATASVDALKWLAGRSGPQDWTRQDYIENGQAAPGATSSATFSPLDIINEAYKPSTAAAPSFDTAPAGGGAGLLGSTAQQPAAGTSPAAPTTPATSGWTQPAPATGLLGNTQPTPSGGGNNGAMGSSLLGSDPLTAPTYQQPNLPRFAGGGSAIGEDGAAAVVGDRPGKATGVEEVAYAHKNPQTGKVELDVIPHSALGGLLDKVSGHGSGIVHNAKKLDPALLAMLPRAFDGGAFGGSDQWGGNTPGLTPVTRQDSATQGGPSGVMTPGPVSQPAGPGNGWAGPSMAPPSGPVSAPGRMEDGPGSGWTAPAPTGTGGATSTTSSTAQPGTASGLLSGVPAGVAGLANNGAPPPNTANPGQYDPYRITVNKYAPDVMNNTPILRKLRGTMGGSIGFRGYGADGNWQGAIPSQGISNLPVHLNLRTILGASPDEQTAAQAAYNNPESGLSWQNILAMSRAAAPGTGQFGLAHAR